LLYEEDPSNGNSSNTDEGFTRFLQLVLSNYVTPELSTLIASVHSNGISNPDEENVINTGIDDTGLTG
jgi:hypothetical protein